MLVDTYDLQKDRMLSIWFLIDDTRRTLIAFWFALIASDPTTEVWSVPNA